MTTIQVHIPDDLAGKMSKFTVNAEAFIIDLLRSRVKELDKGENIANEYHLASIENKKLMKEFSIVDLENWEDEY